MMLLQPTQTYRWLGLSFEVPKEWEIVRHSTSTERGRLVLVDRRRQRLEVCWSECKKEPDLERLVEEFRGESALPGEVFTRSGSWRGLSSPASNDDVITRAVRWDEARSRLVEIALVASGSDPADRRLVDELLDGFGVQDEDRSRRHSAFDLDVTVPEPLELVRADVRAADVSFEFRPGAKKDEANCAPRAAVRRMGMARAWFNGNLEALIGREAPKSRLRFETCRRGPHAAVEAVAHEPGALPRLLGFGRQRRLLSWSCPERNAVYVTMTVSRSKTPLLPRMLSVRCCGGDE